MMDTLPFTAIVLSGGESSRMKTEKGLVSFRGKAMIQHVLETVSKVTNKVILIANHPGYQNWGILVFRTCFPVLGLWVESIVA
ncbi:MAG: NTP transferase domain-containing protein [Bacteroidetes bacterium]|nr:NTP transferase domain-containing protein [Bacteroidota bacterium]